MQCEGDEVHVQDGVVNWQDEEILVQVHCGGDKIHGEGHGPEKEHCPATTTPKEPPEKSEKLLEVDFVMFLLNSTIT